MQATGTVRVRSEESPAAAQAHERERLILEHLPQVRLIARRIHDRLPDSVNLEDLVSTGVIGLIAAIDRFDPAHNVKLKTYAEYKIRGAILDSLRGLDWAPRQQRKRTKQIDAAVKELEQKLQREPSEEEIAAHLGIAMGEYHDWLIEIRAVNMSSLEFTASEDDGRDLLRCLADNEDHWPSALLEAAEGKRQLAAAIERIPSNEKRVLQMYFLEEFTLREIAQVIHLHESRVSQLKTQALARLRGMMQGRPVAKRARA